MKSAASGATIELTALDGANPLGFLAAVGTLVTISSYGQARARLRWSRGRTWTPVIDGAPDSDMRAFTELVARALRGSEVAPDADAARRSTQKAMEEVKTRVRKKLDEIKKRKLSPEGKRTAVEDEVRPLERECEARRHEWLEALTEAVPRPELALGKRIDCTASEYRQHTAALLSRSGVADREALDLLASFGSDAVVAEKSEILAPTPFCFISGSGGQYFLETVRQLMEKVTPDRVRKALFEPWDYGDEGLSMRWDPVEDRRYALMAEDPGRMAPRTVWMANLLAYRALALYPSMPCRRGSGATGWVKRQKDYLFTWPIWSFPLHVDTMRSILTITSADPPSLRSLGLAALYQSRRIKVGSGSTFKWNFTPARSLFNVNAAERDRR